VRPSIVGFDGKRSLALPKVFNGIDFAKMFTGVASPSRETICCEQVDGNLF
jgi:hypothetical protein